MGYTATIGAATGWLSDTGTDENLNGTETCIISIPNISANLTIVATDGVGLLKWNGATLFEGTYTGANHKVDILDVTVIPTVYYKMTFKEITGDYTAEFASTIFGDICYAAGVTGSWTTGTDPQISVKFIRASCYDAASFLADIVNDDHWSEHATNTYTIGPRGSNKGALIVVEDDSASRIKDRKGLPNIIYVRGSDSVGKYIEGVYDDGIGTKVRSYTEKKASDTATLDLLAKKYYDQLHTEDGPSTIPVRIDQMYNKFVGDTVTMTSVPLGLSGSYRLSRIVRRLDSVSVSVTSPNKSLEQRVIDLKKYEDFGIYVTAGVSKSMQNWSSDILITPIDYDTANWSAGTIKFSDGDSQVIDSGTTGNLGVDGLYFLYFTLSDPTMLVTADYDIAVSATTAIFAKLTVVTGQIIGIESPNSATQTKINSVFISDDSVIAEAMSPGVQPYIADIEFSPVIGNEHNSVEWTAGTITFADGTTWATDPGNSGALPDGEFRWIYFSTISTSLGVTSTYADVNTNTTGLLAKIYVSVRAEQEIMIVSFRCKGDNIIADALGAKSVDSDIITSLSIAGKDIATDFLVGESAGGVRMIGVGAGIIGSAINDGFGGYFAQGIYGFYKPSATIYRTFWLNPVTGHITVYGQGNFEIRDALNTFVGEINGTTLASRLTMQIYGHGSDVAINADAHLLQVRNDGDIDIKGATTLDLSHPDAGTGEADARLVIPIRLANPPSPRNGELWMGP